MTFKLPPLPYAYDALAPYMSAETLEYHHDKHHQAYVDKANAALEGTEWADKDVEEVLENLDSLPADKQTAVRNNGGGHANHTFFWREPHHFEYFRDKVRPGLVQKLARGEAVRIWSAGSSSGEEVYSLIMTLLGTDPRDQLLGLVAATEAELLVELVTHADPSGGLAPLPTVN